MTREIVEARMEAAQNELNARTTELSNLEARAQEIVGQVHNLKVQIATYQDLLTDNTADTTTEVRETVETLLTGE